MAAEDALFIRGTVNRLEELAEENSRLFKMGKKNEMFDLVSGLKSLSSTVELASKNERAKYALKDMVEKIQNVISDAEHAMCMYTVERKRQTTSEAKCNRAFSGEIQSMRDRVKTIMEDDAQTVKLLIYHTPITNAYVIQLAHRLGEVVEENVSLLKEINNQVEDLVDDIEASIDLMRSNDVLGNQIRNVVMKVDDVICKYTVEKKKKKHKDKGWWVRYSRITASAKDMKAIRDSIRKINESNAAALQVHTPITGTYAIQLDYVMEENMWSFPEVIKNQVEDLMRDMNSYNAYVEEASRNTGFNHDNQVILKDVVNQIRNMVMEAEDAICKYMVEKKKHKHKGWCLIRYFQSPAYNSRITDSAKEIKAIRERFKKEFRESCVAAPFMNDHSKAQPAISLQAPVVEEDDVVGFDSEAKSIKDCLIEGPDDLMIISIEGMVGLGKTTLTNMVFNDTDIQYHFFTRLWIYVSRTMNRKRIFFDILCMFTRHTDEFKGMSEEKLADKIKEYLEGGRYFIVLDHVCTKDDWNSLQIAFPNNKKGSRILLNTRHHNVASHVASSGNSHQLKFLSDNESWELLKKKVFRQERCPPQLEATGKIIAHKCNGVPLAVLVIAGVLDKNSSAEKWKSIAEDPFPIINRKHESYHELVRLSYDYLQPYNLQDCFLYLAVFPTGHEIIAWKLIRLWISEGFIPQIDGGNNSELEVTAEKYLKELVDSNLLMVMKRRADGKIKTCRIHDTLHEFCKTEAASKNLFHEMNGARFELNITHRRLCVRSSIIEFLRSENMPSSEHVRSFLSSCSNEKEIPTEHLAVIPKSFPLLRVMDVESLKFKLLPQNLYQLSLLKYLAVSTDLKLLPKTFSNLWNMQTLVLINTSGNSLEVKADIWSMRKLRHVHSNTSIVLPPPPKKVKNSSGSTKIQTLSTISPSSCTWEILEKTPNLKKLGIRGNLAELMESKGKGGVMLFDNLEILDCLENLKLINNALKLGRCPHSKKFPPRLRKMTLSNTGFEWKDLNILGSLQVLEVLKLDENAFTGKFCDVTNIVFRQLQYLRIGRTNLVSWKVSKGSFPALKHLILRHCDALESVPAVFGEVESLKVMELYCTNGRAANSARQIQKLKNEKQCGFQLSINPPDH